MKRKFATLFVILGGVIAGFTFTHFLAPELLVAVVGGLFLGMSLILYTSVYAGKVWGIKIKASFAASVVSFVSVIGLVIGGYSIVITFLAAFTALTRGDIITVVIDILGFVIPFAIGPFIAKAFTENAIVAKGNFAMALGEYDIFKEIDANMEEATHFVVGFEGVALYSKTNYCYAVYLYENYRLGELSTPAEVALVGTYFVQKYHEKYTFKVDMEVIPGEPGQTVVAVGTGGVSVGRIKGTPDQRIFRSYIFTKKK